MKQFLVVCTANICRSPLVEGLLRARLAAHQLADQVEVKSTGVYPRAGEKASQYSVELLAAKGIDISRHLAAPFSGLLMCNKPTSFWSWKNAIAKAFFTFHQWIRTKHCC